MDFFNFGKPDKDRTEIQAKKKQRQEYKFIGNIRHQAGHILFSINTITGEIKQAEFQKEPIITWEQAKMVNDGVGLPRKVIIEKDCVYIEAMNEENAIKKYRKSLRQS